MQQQQSSITSEGIKDEYEGSSPSSYVPQCRYKRQEWFDIEDGVTNLQQALNICKDFKLKNGGGEYRIQEIRHTYWSLPLETPSYTA